MIELDAGTIHYDTFGPKDGRPVVFVHGYWMGGEVWHQVGQQLADRGLRIVPTWPMGGHPQPLRPAPTPTITGVAATVANFLAALNLTDVVLVGNDSGGVVYSTRCGALP